MFEVATVAQIATSKTLRRRHRVFEKTGGFCSYCGKKLDFDQMVISRILPPFRGGTRESNNLVPACIACNRKKCLKASIESQGEMQDTFRVKHRRETTSAIKKQKILLKNNNLCAYCGKELTVEFMTVDHVLPLARGGGNKIENLVPACLECNRSKSTMTLEEYNSIFKKPRIFFKYTVKKFRWLYRVAKHFGCFRR